MPSHFRLNALWLVYFHLSDSLFRVYRFLFMPMISGTQLGAKQGLGM
jgi:hypothetical protein